MSSRRASLKTSQTSVLVVFGPDEPRIESGFYFRHVRSEQDHVELQFEALFNSSSYPSKKKKKEPQDREKLVPVPFAAPIEGGT
jgi:hypothetical protein